MARVGQDLAPQPRITRLGCCERSPSGALRAPDGVLAAGKRGSCPAEGEGCGSGGEEILRCAQNDRG